MDVELLYILLPAFAAGILVLSTHVVLGRQVLKRGIIFIDLAIAQVAALGAIWAKTSHDLELLPYVQVWMPALFAIAGATVIAFLARHFKHELEAMIGCLYVLSAVAAMLILANDPHGAELLKQLMSGQILWVDWQQLILPAVVYALVLIGLWLKPQLMNGSAFYLLFAIVITLSVEMVGVYLVFSSLILPALAINRDTSNHALVKAYVVGFIGFVTGLYVSASWDLPSGATIVVCLAITSIAYRSYTSLISK